MSSEFAKWTFGTLEAVLSEVHDIADSKRTAFQARLKNLHRLKFPVGLDLQKGKAAQYGAGDIMMMALAVEMTQLGLSPDALVRTLTINWYPTAMALKMAAYALNDPKALVSVPDTEEEYFEVALPMFLYFDPSALSGLTENWAGRPQQEYERPSETFFYGGIGVIRESIARWTSSDINRLSLINVTALMGRIADAASTAGHGAFTKAAGSFYADVIHWAEELLERGVARHARQVLAMVKSTAPPNADQAALHREIKAMLRHLDLDGPTLKELFASVAPAEVRRDNVDPEA